MDLRSKYGILQKLSFEKLYVSFLGLQSREQVLILAVSGVVMATLLLSPIIWASATLSGIKENMIKAGRSLVQIDQKIGELGQIQTELKGVEARFRSSGSRSISTVLEGLAQEGGLSGSIDSIKERPSRSGSDVLDENGVDVRVSKVSLEALVGFLYSIESNMETRLKIKSMQVKPRFKMRNQLDANIEVVSYVLKGEEL